MPFTVDVPVRWSDLDAQAHVNNAVIVDYLQQARIGALFAGPMSHLLGNGIVVVGHEIEYLHELSFGAGPVEALVRVGNVRGASFTYAYELSQGDRVAIRARTDACLFDFETGRPRRFTPEEKTWFDSVAEPLPDLPPLPDYRVKESAHEHLFTVRWSDVDAYGHVNNVQFYGYLTEARVALHREVLPGVLTGTEGLTLDAREDLPAQQAGASASGVVLIARQDMRYINQMVHRLEPYLVRTAIGRVGRTSVTYAHEIIDPLDGRVMARAKAVIVHADRTKRPAPVPESMRDAASRWPAAD